MKMTRWLASGAAVVATVLVTACVPSIHPFHSEETRVFDAGLVGTWAKPNEETERWAFSRADSGGDAYRLVFTDNDGNDGEFVAHLLELGDARFLDLLPEEPKSIENGFYKYHLLPAHTLLRVTRDGDALSLAAMNPEWVDAHLKSNPGALAHERTDDRLVLTASTAELQAFVRKHADTAEVFGDPVAMRRRGDG